MRFTLLGSAWGGGGDQPQNLKPAAPQLQRAQRPKQQQRRQRQLQAGCAPPLASRLCWRLRVRWGAGRRQPCSQAEQQQLVAREHDTFEVVSFLRAENDTLQERLKHFEGRRRTCARARVLVAYAASGQVARAKLDAARARVAEIVGMVLAPGWKRPVRTLSPTDERPH